MDFHSLRKKHAEFIYSGFEINFQDENLRIYFNFELTPNVKFRPEIIFPFVSKERIKEIGENTLRNLIFNLGMVELLSYWKATCSPIIKIQAGYLNEQQIEFWRNLLLKGLGEFFYTNEIDFTGGGSATKKDLVEFQVESNEKFSVFDGELKGRDLILVGGGKDSAVTLDKIASSGKEFNCLILNPSEAMKKISLEGGCNNPIIVKRTIDPKLLELNAKGYLNGHTPFSAYLAFLSVLCGLLYDYKNLVVSNEASSEEANVSWKGAQINHQYSKTQEFENLFREYSHKYLSLNYNYFSNLRSLSELQISAIFAKLPQYHKLFRSCNKGSKTGVWCGLCPKCVSTYLTLYPFLGDKTKEIFGKNLLEDEKLIPIVKDLLRENNVVKPFECVATIEEIKEAILLGRKRAKEDNLKIPKVLQAVYET